jgi:hypothetical protein
MSIAKGRVVDKEGKGLEKLTVLLEDVSQVHDHRFLGKAEVTNSDGLFSIEYDAVAASGPVGQGQRRQLQVIIRLGQLILKKAPPQFDEGTEETLDFNTIEIPRPEAESWRATLGSGQETRVSKGNAIRWLADNVDGWSSAAHLIENASTLDVMQLTVDIGDFKKDDPVVILKFDPADKLSFHPSDSISNGKFVIQAHQSNFSDATQFKDHRVEQSLLAVAETPSTPKEVRIQIPRMSLDPHLYRDLAIGLTVGAAVLALGAGAIFLIGGIVVIIAYALAVIAGLAGLAANILPAMPQIFGELYTG